MGNSSTPGHVMKYGTVPPLPEWIRPDDEREIYFWKLQHPDSAIYEVVPQQHKPLSQHPLSFPDFSYLTRVQDQELTLGQVWNVETLESRRNASNGECDNEEIGIKYEYDLGGKLLFVSPL
jgi:hypothetical protein